MHTVARGTTETQEFDQEETHIYTKPICILTKPLCILMPGLSRPI